MRRQLAPPCIGNLHAHGCAADAQVDLVRQGPPAASSSPARLEFPGPPRAPRLASSSPARLELPGPPRAPPGVVLKFFVGVPIQLKEKKKGIAVVKTNEKRWVPVFEDPITKKKEEGMALLISLDKSLTREIDEKFELQYWTVSLEGEQVERWIKARR